EAFVEVNLAANGWDADAISVMGDAGNDAGEQPVVRRHVWTVAINWSKPKRVQAKLGARAHRKNVANDSAHAGGRALKRLDRARVIVAFHLERNRPAVADIDHAGIFFAGLHQNVRAARRKFFQLAPRVLIGAMLTPHHGEDSQLGKIRLPT